MPRILLIDNYDSFTYNLFHYLEEINEGEISVMRNNQIDFSRVDEFDKIVISPGPGLPKEAGDLMLLLNQCIGRNSILGVCLGQQAIAEHFGMGLKNLEEVIHGQSTPIRVVQPNSIFNGLPKAFNVGRYHSWVIDQNHFIDAFEVTAVDEKGDIMGIKHKVHSIEAVQFHPESVLTDYGKELLKNWLKST